MATTSSRPSRQRPNVAPDAGERVPLSGAARYRGSGADVDLYVFGPDAAPIVCEVKARANGEGFATLERWLGDADALFLRRGGRGPGGCVVPRLSAAGRARHGRFAGREADNASYGKLAVRRLHWKIRDLPN
jgi:hypothetical protein